MNIKIAIYGPVPTVLKTMREMRAQSIPFLECRGGKGYYNSRNTIGFYGWLPNDKRFEIKLLVRERDLTVVCLMSPCPVEVR